MLPMTGCRGSSCRTGSYVVKAHDDLPGKGQVTGFISDSEHPELPAMFGQTSRRDHRPSTRRATDVEPASAYNIASGYPRPSRLSPDHPTSNRAENRPDRRYMSSRASDEPSAAVPGGSASRAPPALRPLGPRGSATIFFFPEDVAVDEQDALVHAYARGPCLPGTGIRT